MTAVTTVLLIAACTGGTDGSGTEPAITESATDAAPPDGDGAITGADGDTDDEAGSVTASEPFAAIPTDGSEPGTQLDIGGPGLGGICEEGAQPVPIDTKVLSCKMYDGAPVSPDADWGGSVGDRLEPGTYWAVLVCDGIETVEIKFDTAPGLPATATEIPCSDGTEAARVELGTVEAEATSDWGVRPTGEAPDGTFLFYLVLEGQTA